MYYWSDIDIVLTDWGPEIDSIQNGERTQQTRRSASSGNLWPTEGMLSSLFIPAPDIVFCYILWFIELMSEHNTIYCQNCPKLISRVIINHEKLCVVHS